SFQAEDGRRDFHVTGVQTCALPIYASGDAGGVAAGAGGVTGVVSRSTVETGGFWGAQIGGGGAAGTTGAAGGVGAAGSLVRARRSEERRVGKESTWVRSRAQSGRNV